MKKILLTLTTISLLIFQISSCKKSSYSEYRAIPDLKELKVQIDTNSFIPIKIEIPDDAYVYANPKGPGIGKAIEAYAEENSDIIYSSAKYPQGKKYIAKGEKKHVYIYKNEEYIFIPFSVKDNASQNSYEAKIYINSLMCTNRTCIPKNSVINVPLIIVDNKSDATNFKKDLLNRFKEAGNSDKSNNITQKKTSSTESNNFKDYKFKPLYLDTGITGLLQAILFGLIAGLILNFMPCVLPVVSLKIMSFVQSAGESKKSLFLMGLLFSIGILVSFAVLAALAAFFGYNWGGLFQHPAFLIVMISIVFALGLSMFDVFSINIPSFISRNVEGNTNIYLDAFFKGLLATLLATPCSGPFLGGTLAWALSQPPLTIFTIFMSVGTGMALPYFILTINPKFLKFVPKPGPWLVNFERLMGFLLVFTVVYLLSILEISLIKPVILFLVFLSIGLWQFGVYGSVLNSRLKRVISFIVLIIILFSGYFLSFNYFYEENKSLKIQSKIFSPEAIIANKNYGKISIVKFTADWCPNCKFVEKMSLNTAKVKEFIDDRCIELFTADITRKNSEAEELLNKLGNYSIPVLAILPPGDSFTKPICLRDIYSEKDVIRAIERAIKLRKHK